MANEKKTLFTDAELYRLLDEIDQFNDEMIVPLTDDEVATLSGSGISCPGGPDNQVTHAN